MSLADELMPLLTELRAVEGPPDGLTPELMRLGFDPLWASWAGVAPDVEVDDRTIDGPASELALRVYRPTRRAEHPRPLVLDLHGGGFVIGSIASNDATARELAQRSDAVVASLEYRLAPEHRYPAASDDALAALNWLAANADALGADAQRLVIAGDSAGANLAATTALRARDDGTPQVALQVLLYPCLDPSCSSASMSENAQGYLLRRDVMAWFWAHYLGSNGDRRDPYVDPRQAHDLAGLPPAVIITAEYDPLRDEGDEYARLLSAAGVDVKHYCADGMVHGFASMLAVTSRAGEALDAVAASIRDL